ncbi:dmX-like protein 1 isoform X4 [Athene noctua]|uniref:dmX-like protein 1 isoform X4 n=1 Tax=Athene noctua TaxID=126797 RepID=UPI003EB95E0F
MNLHQVLTGAVNPGDNCFSVGSLYDQPFTAYASGCDIVVLGTDFERLQIIPGAKHGNIQVGCVDCSMQQGKIAASYGKVICIFEPVSLLKQNSSHHNKLHYQWQKNAQILLEAMACNLTWDPTGTRLLTGSSCLQLWSNVPLENPSDNDTTERTDVGLGEWRCIWQCKTASQVSLMKFSPDGEFFATAGKDDCLVKVWYSTDSWRSAVTPPGASTEKQAKEVDYSFVYLAHPRSVNAFSWRKTSKFMPRGAVCNVLLTCCKDNVCRLWAETLLPNDSLLYGGGYKNWSKAVNFTNSFKRNTSSKEKVQNALELNLKHFRRGRRRMAAVVAHTGYAPHQQDPHEVHKNIPPHANALCHFHIAASINPATDIPLLPSITSLSLGENEEKSGPFVVHWLNNKELHFTLSMEVFLQQLKKNFEHHSPDTNTEESNQMDGRSEEEVDENGDEQKGNQEKKELGDEKTASNSSLVPLSSAIIDHEIEVLLSEWSKNADMLFSIHPMDGSLLVWHVDWLDEYQPGMFRQVQVSFVSRIPVAFPTGDANSLCRSVVMYACTKNVDLAIQQGKQKPLGLTRSSSMLISSGHSKSTNSLKLSIFTPNVMMISKHADGSLNQWLVSFAEESAFSTVLSISHKSRYCGHRFHLNDLACHSVLPLLLTTSHHNALISPDVENEKQANDSVKSQESPVRLQSRGNANVTSQDPNVVYSELILWRVDPVGPLSFSGGVSELARINSLHVSAFSNVAWLPTLIPSYCLGAYCNSPSACFVASDGQHLRLYQAVIDAKKLLCELSNPEISKYVGEVFNIISQQSTARPGCIIELDAITELHGRKTQLFHVFQEDFILNNQEKEIPEKKNLSISGNQQNGFSEKFYLIVIEYTQTHSLLHMWHLHLKSIPVSVDEKIDSNTPEAGTQTEELYSSPDPEKIQSPFTQKYQACRANLQSTSWLTLSSKMVYSQELNLPEGVEIISVKPSAGHLSSSSIYPVCRAPYLLATSCSDGKVRFWRCRVITESSGSSMPEYSAHSDVAYVWEEWPLLIEDGLLSSSAINVPGRPTEVSCAHTNRLAVAYKQYHPYQLLELMDLGKVRRAKAILSHLVKCIAGEVVAVSDSEPNPDKKLRSLTISASGSTARDPKTFSKTETTDYIEIDSVPPLPLYALLAADDDSCHSCSEKFNNQNSQTKKGLHNDSYEDLFQNTVTSTDELVTFDADEDSLKPKVIDLSQYSPTYFGPEHAQVLSCHLLHSSLPGLTRMEQMSLMALADTIATTSTDIGESRDRNQGGETLDECGLKFLLAVRRHTFLSTSLPPVHRAQLLHQGLSTSHFAWAFHSVAEEELLSMLPAVQKGDPTWSELRAMGIGWWVRNIHSLRKCIEKVAKAAFQRNNDPLDAAIFYLAMKKKAVIWGLYRSQKDTKMTQFFGNNFTEDRWRKAALKNAFSLLGKQRFEHSAAFFLLAGHLKDAVEVCLEKLNDIQLALVISRLYESEFEVSSTYKSVLQKRILGCVLPGKENSENVHCDPFLRSMAYWILEDYSKALDTLIKHSVEGDGDGSSSCNPAVFNFYNYLRTHPLLLRRHFGSSDRSSTHICLTVENGLADKINLGERRLFFTTAYAHLKAGCPMLALEVLSKMPKVVKRSKSFYRSPSLMDTSKDFSPSSPVKDLETKDQSSSIDWSQPILNGLGSSSDCSSGKHSSSSLPFDWSQQSMIIQNEHLKLQSDSDESDGSEDSSLVMKELKPMKKTEKLCETSSSYTESFSVVDDKDILSPSEDIISAQLKFRACLKILTVELRTLSTGYEVDGGKLRYQLYQWLEREVIALQKTCDYSVEEIQSGISVMPEEAPLHENTEDLADQQKNTMQKEDFQKRRQWLLKYQSLLRMFLSYCILHGSHGGGLASVRMELILLLQESQQEQSMQIPSSPLPEQSSIPLLFACTASAKTVVANPLLHLGNLTHDILHAIINLDSPPHPDTQNNKIYVMHTLAASLSACIYQCLCDGHSYSSFQANQFTGTVYQTVLLTQRHSLRTTSLEETVTPNTSPAQWPGITALMRLLNSAGEEAQPGLTVLLCEILTAVYLSLFIHGLATHSSNELYRIMAHPLSNKMWSAVFGGGAHMPSRGQLQLKTKTGGHFPMPSPHQVVVFSMECVGFSKSLTAFSTHSSTKSSDDGEKQQKCYKLSSKTSPKESSQLSSLPLVDQESPFYKERFVPPELSIWDYFIAKPFLPSQSRVEYDSEESQGSGEDDEDTDGDVFASDSHNQEHSNSNSYSWSLMRLSMVQLVLHNLKIFYPLAGHDLSELPVSSPMCHAVLKTLQRWEQVLLRRLELYGGPPQHYISVHASEDALAAGPALLRHKTLLEPTNTPFRSSSHVALSVKRLWQYLVKQEEVQETFIRNIFTKKRCLNKSLEEHNETMKNSVVEEPIINKIETDWGHGEGKARIIHKESDIITAFAVNKANRNCIAIASSHDIQELDVSAILATQIYTWVDDDTEVENKGADDFLVVHARDDLVNVQGTTPYTHSNPGTPINMPWLGSTQTGRGASVEYSNKFNGIRNELARKEMLKKAINNVRRMASHPTLPYYLTGAQDGSVRMFEWGHAQQITCFRSGGNSRVTRMRFNYQGNKFGIVDADGYISLYQTNWKCCSLTGTSPKPYLTWQCHNKTANDFVFISSSSLIATAGLSSDSRNICLWDTLVSPTNSLVHAFICHDSGATVLAYAPKHQLLISGGRKGFTCIIDLRQKQQQQLLQSHDSPVKAIAVDPTEEYFVTGSAEGNIKVWSLSTFNLLHTFINEHARQSLFRNIGTGVMQIETGPANHILSCGADGTVKMRVLPDRFSPLNDVLKNDLKLMI